MKTHFRTALSICGGLGLALLVAAPQATAATPGQLSYSYSSPVVSVYAGVQVGNNKTTTVHQNSAVNISSVTQVGNNISTTVVQRGVSNTSAVSQTGHNSSAVVIQFGRPMSLLGGP